jgi:hypothetical protein
MDQVFKASYERAARLAEKKMPLQAYQTSQYVVPCGSTFLGKCRSNFTESSNGKMNVPSACTLNILYI